MDYIVELEAPKREDSIINNLCNCFRSSATYMTVIPQRYTHRGRTDNISVAIQHNQKNLNRKLMRLTQVISYKESIICYETRN